LYDPHSTVFVGQWTTAIYNQPTMVFNAAFFAVSIRAGAVAAISGFGIGSLLTSFVLTLRYVIKAAAAIVSVPHLIDTAALPRHQRPR
jgi:uncharacterized membrane protein (DUF485 family)